MTQTTYVVSGMTCEHCVRAVTAELASIPGVSAVTVDLPSGRAVVTSEAPVADADIARAVDEAGYTLATQVA